MRYQTPDNPAENINVLIEYLSRQEGRSKFIYRGQVKEWSGPLIPSVYRRSIALGRIFTDQSTEYELSLRKCGKRFVEMKPDSRMEKIVQGYKDITSEEYKAMTYLAGNLECSILLEKEGWESILLKFIKPDRRDHVRQRISMWREIVDELQRGRIRQYGFCQPFGYMLGMTLAQQYGFSSELLDFTSDLIVAAFFATHDGPKYLFSGETLIRSGSGLGVIYRLPSTEGEIKYKRIDEFNYYRCPPQLHMSDLCMRFEDKSSPDMSEQWLSRLSPEEIAALRNANIPLAYIEGMLIEMEMRERKFPLEEAIDKYLHLYYSEWVRYYRLLDNKSGSFGKSRLGRQRAVLVVPDELRHTVKPEFGDHYATFQAVEDVSKRDGFERFYFRHTQHCPSDRKINRELLWPSENDVFKLLISKVIDPKCESYEYEGMIIPKRISLVSEGYSF